MTQLKKKLIEKIKKLIKKIILYRYCFPKKLGLDLLFTSRDLKNRIPRRQLCIQSYSQAETPRYRPKYLKHYFLIGFGPRPVLFLNWFMGLKHA